MRHRPATTGNYTRCGPCHTHGIAAPGLAPAAAPAAAPAQPQHQPQHQPKPSPAPAKAPAQPKSQGWGSQPSPKGLAPTKSWLQPKTGPGPAQPEDLWDPFRLTSWPYRDAKGQTETDCKNTRSNLQATFGLP